MIGIPAIKTSYVNCVKSTNYVLPKRTESLPLYYVATVVANNQVINILCFNTLTYFGSSNLFYQTAHSCTIYNLFIVNWSSIEKLNASVTLVISFKIYVKTL